MWFTSVRLTFVAIRGRRVHMFVPRDKKVHALNGHPTVCNSVFTRKLEFNLT